MASRLQASRGAKLNVSIQAYRHPCILWGPGPVFIKLPTVSAENDTTLEPTDPAVTVHMINNQTNSNFVCMCKCDIKPYSGSIR